MVCNYCGCEESDIIAEYTRFEKNNVLQCKNCGLVYLEIKKGKEAIESFYSSEYRKVPTLPMLSAEEHFNDKVTQNDANNRVQFISNYMDIKDKRILEIGSASGSLLQKLSECGCKEAVGVELDEKYSEYARQRGFKVFTRPIEELNLKEEFDGVVSFHTLEHVYNPMMVIRAVYAALRPGVAAFWGKSPIKMIGESRYLTMKLLGGFIMTPIITIIIPRRYWSAISRPAASATSGLRPWKDITAFCN